MSDIKKVVLAYSGGLDTSVIVRWLQDTYECEVVTFTADIGQGEEVEPAREKAKALGVKEIYIEDLREEFVRDYVFPMFRANTIYEGEYLLGTSIARPLISRRLIEIANETGADAISHGATGKGNDQVRFELGRHLDQVGNVLRGGGRALYPSGGLVHLVRTAVVSPPQSDALGVGDGVRLHDSGSPGDRIQGGCFDRVDPELVGVPVPE